MLKKLMPEHCAKKFPLSLSLVALGMDLQCTTDCEEACARVCEGGSESMQASVCSV